MLYWIVDGLGTPREKKEFKSDKEALQYAEDRFGEDATYWEVSDEKKKDIKQKLTQYVSKILNQIRQQMGVSLELKNVFYYDDPATAMISFNPTGFIKDFVSDTEHYQFLRRDPDAFDIILYATATEEEIDKLIDEFISFCKE